MVRAGKLRHRIRLMRDTGTGRDDAGAPIPLWQEMGQRWASVEPLQGRELFLAQQVNADIATRVRMRPFDGLTPKDRIDHRGRILEVSSIVNDDERGILYDCLCREVV